MSPLVAELYHYILERRLGAYLQQTDYHMLSRQARHQQELLTQVLPPAVLPVLESYLEVADKSVLAELEAMFQAGLAAGLELSRL